MLRIIVEESIFKEEIILMKENKLYFKYWGKADHESQYHLLPYHCLDVAAVANELLLQHPFVLGKLSRLMDLTEEDTRLWLVFILGIHDLGKFAESFQQLRTDLRTQALGHVQPEKVNYDLRHDSLGYLIWFDKRQGLSRYYQENGFVLSPPSKQLDNVVKKLFPVWFAPVMGHHGFPPETKNRVKEYFQKEDMENTQLFVDDWLALVDPNFKSILSCSDDNKWIKKQKEASWLIAGLAVLCDWLGSNSDDFKFEKEPISLESYWTKKALPQARKAINKAGLLPSHIKKACTIGKIFTYIKEPTPLQKKCTELTMPDEPQLFILEDVTGSGKTEAALMLAYRLMEKNLAQGFFVGLPTMATANAMLERMARVYRNFYTDNSQPNVVLSHSARHLSKLFQSAFLDYNKKSKETYTSKDETISIQCNRWLADHRKKSLLADIGIGTIDQALLSILPVRHQSLRLYGLANKVLILDEIHAYDAYTGSLLKTLLEFHAALRGSVILLSATLSKQQRQSFVNAFNKGLGKQNLEVANTSFPLLTQISAQIEKEYSVQTRRTVQREVGVIFIHRQEDVINRIIQAVKQGQCVCWIRNTVPDAREAFTLLSGLDELSNGHVHLFHSRYSLGDRLDIEQLCLNLFGQQSTSDKRKGQVLIATQVIEQSLDLDFDIMISDLAPIDLLIQRAGRLKRHIRDKAGSLIPDGDQDERGQVELNVYAPEYTDKPESDWYQSVFPKANYVYPDTGLLWLTCQILDKKGGWTMPEDARELIEFVYGENLNDLPESLQDSHNMFEGTEMGHRGMAAFNGLKHEMGYISDYRVETPWDDEAKFPTRLGEDTHTLYLARWENNQLLPWVNKGAYRWDLSSINVNKGLITELAIVQDGELKQALASLREAVPVFDEYSLIIPLQKDDGEWQAEGCNDREDKMNISYNCLQGLIIGRNE